MAAVAIEPAETIGELITTLAFLAPHSALSGETLPAQDCRSQER